MLRALLASTLRIPRPFNRAISTIRVFESTCSKSLALPLCFVSIKGWDKTHSNAWKGWIDKFAQKGYTSLLCEIDPESSSAKSASTSSDVLSSLENELLSLLRDPSASSPFPPLLFASSSSTLLAETYVSSHPLSGLVLHDPLPAPLANSSLPQAFPTKLVEFDYEPFFPVAVIQGEGVGEECRLARDFGGEDEDALVRKLTGGRDEEGWNKVMEWMDENGL